MIALRFWHRRLGAVLALALAYLAVSGLAVQAVDLAAVLRGAPPTDPAMQAIGESLDGPANFAVIAPADALQPVLPAGLDWAGAARRVALAAAPLGQIRHVELRMADGRPQGRVRLLDAGGAERLARIDPATGAVLAFGPMPPDPPRPHAAHDLAKHWHRLWALGDTMLWLDALLGIGLGIMTLLGLALWWRMWRQRARRGRLAPWWRGGGWLRMGHRAVPLVMALPLLVVAASGTILAVDSLALGIYRLRHPENLVFGMVPRGMVADYSAPLAPGEVVAMARASARAWRHAGGAASVRVVRWRVFAAIPQAVIVTADAPPRQVIFNARTGSPMGLSAPGYPDTVFPTGWALHETLKRVHRGDIVGLPGRFLDVAAGLALLWFAASGLWLWDEPRRRRAAAARNSAQGTP